MQSKTIIFRGDPIEEMNGCFNLNRKMFHLNEMGMDEIKNYSKIIEEKEVPPLLKEKIIKENEDQIFYMLTSERETTENKKIPQTFLAIENTNNSDYPYRILGTYSSRGLYIMPIKGEEVYLQMKQNKLKSLIKINK